MNAEIATCAIAGRAANWTRGQSRPWKGHIVIVLDPFLILPRDRRNATRRAPKRVNGKAALWDRGARARGNFLFPKAFSCNVRHIGHCFSLSISPNYKRTPK